MNPFEKLIQNPVTPDAKPAAPEKNSDYANRMKEIRRELEGGADDVMGLDQDFVELWKEIPDDVDDSVYEDIDEIKMLLMDARDEGRY